MSTNQDEKFAGGPCVIELEGSTAVLVNWAGGEVPDFIEVRDRGTDAEVEAAHVAFAKTLDEKVRFVLGEKRNKHFDTGQEAFKNLLNVQVSMLRVGLINAGMVLSDLYAFKRDKGKTIRMVYVPKGVQKPKALSRRETEYVRKLANMTCSYAHGWVNPTHIHTVNLAGKRWSPGDNGFKAAEHELVIRDGKILPKILVPETETADC